MKCDAGLSGSGAGGRQLAMTASRDRESKVFELSEGGAAERKAGRRKLNVFAKGEAPGAFVISAVEVAATANTRRCGFDLQSSPQSGRFRPT